MWPHVGERIVVVVGVIAIGVYPYVVLVVDDSQDLINDGDGDDDGEEVGVGEVFVVVAVVVGGVVVVVVVGVVVRKYRYEAVG